MPSLAEFIRSTVETRQMAAIRLDEPVPVEALHTPALLLDLEVFERNLDKMQRHLTAHGMGLRCHTKTHKCPLIAKKQVEKGAIGVCAATVSEAEMMFAGGVGEILITSPVVTAEKVERVIDLAAANPGLQVVVDHHRGADLMNQAAARKSIVLRVLIDLDPAMGRTGIETGDAAVALGRHIVDNCPHLVFSGLQMYAGHCMHVHGFEKRKGKYRHIMQKGVETRAAFEREGIHVSVFTGGGTGTWDIEPELGLLTDLQAGSYGFMDVEYLDIGGSGGAFDGFAPSLFVLVTAISKPQSALITVDAGFKALATDTVAPRFRDVEGVTWHWGGDEHGIISLDNPSRDIVLGDKLFVITPHCDPTVNLHDWCFPYRNGVVEEIWPIAARGCSQ